MRTQCCPRAMMAFDETWWECKVKWFPGSTESPKGNHAWFYVMMNNRKQQQFHKNWLELINEFGSSSKIQRNTFPSFSANFHTNPSEDSPTHTNESTTIPIAFRGRKQYISSLLTLPNREGEWNEKLNGDCEDSELVLHCSENLLFSRRVFNENRCLACDQIH